MDLETTLTLLRSGRDGINEWNRRREAEEAVPSLSAVDLRGSDLRSANLRGLDLRDADLCGCRLSFSNLGYTNLSGTKWFGTKWANKLKQGELGSPSEILELATIRGLETATFYPHGFSPGDLSAVFTHMQNEIEPAIGDSCREERLTIVLEMAEGLTAEEVGLVLDLSESKVKELLARARQRIGKRLRASLKRLQSLHVLYAGEEPPPVLIETISGIRAELVSYLARHPNAMRRLRSRQFEELVAELLASFGWEVELTPPTKDGGYDIFAIAKDITGARTSWLIECKKHASHNRVGIEVARALYGVKTERHVANAMIATTSCFTKGVNVFKASRYDFELRDYEGIIEWLNAYRPRTDGLPHHVP